MNSDNRYMLHMVTEAEYNRSTIIIQERVHNYLLGTPEFVRHLQVTTRKVKLTEKYRSTAQYGFKKIFSSIIIFREQNI